MFGWRWKIKIDNSAFSAYMRCPLLYRERYEATDFIGSKLDETEQAQKGADVLARGELVVLQPGIQLRRESKSLDFGTRMHQLLHERRLARLGLRPAGPGQPASVASSNGTGAGAVLPASSAVESLEGTFQPAPEWPDEAIESECQATLAAYDAHYIRDYEYLESERTHIIDIPRQFSELGAQHQLAVKLDAVVRHADGTIGAFDTKTESKPGYNDRRSWAGRTQAKLYLWALEQMHIGQVSRLVVDVVTRRSAKQQRGPVFTRLDDISSTSEAIADALRNVCYVADRIEEHRRTGWWPANMNACRRGWEECDMYSLHIDGRTAENLRKYRAADVYLEV